MNYTTNERGETVMAEGAPGSEARFRCEYPEQAARLERYATALRRLMGLVELWRRPGNMAQEIHERCQGALEE